MTSTAPRILLTPDHEIKALRRGPAGFYALDERYVHAVIDAGGIPVVAPYLEDQAALHALLDVVTGVVLTGGDFDVAPELFGAKAHPKLGTLKPRRTSFEILVHDESVRRGLPILGVCGGMQLMNVLRGGTLWQDLDSECPSTVAHQQVGPKTEPAHSIDVKADTALARITGSTGTLDVNSTHHQAVRTLGNGLIASGVASDGIIEALEDASLAFYVGVQWHPEAMPVDDQQALYRALVDASR